MTSPSSPSRRNDVDTLRAVVVLLLVPFHTARLFDAEVWPIKDFCAPIWAADVGGFGILETTHAFRNAFRFAGEWCLLLTLLGYGRILLSRPIPTLRSFVPFALPFYLFHQTIIVLLGWLWLNWTGQPLLKAASVLVLSTALSVLLAWGVAQFAITRFATGLPLRCRPALALTLKKAA
ncbi:MAG: hypothetical protein AAGB07_15980 [Pseudomonadota bacterium]